METTEKISVYIDIENGKTVCICHTSAKGCGKNCPRDTVERDKYREWEQTMKRNRYGK